MAQTGIEGMEKELAEYQSLQTQLQYMLFQKQQYKMQLDDADMALGELAKAEGDVYKNAGLLMIKSNKDDALKDLKEKKEFISVRMSSLAKQEEGLREQLEGLKAKLEAAIKRKI
ncbi:MAG: prefoldin subunit beta [Candidatus Burarchaeum sp.]|nr:prefoldin subunit beta [Candidatus Burarchaeum sp.]MDO8339546.1 prefoldin subunit beta [Candidatus Burarchaeum sp.]